jgi:hypothetical protein
MSAEFDAGASYNEGDAPAVFVEILFSLQSMSADGDTVV